MAAKKKAPSRKSAARKKTAKKSSPLRGLSEYGGNKCFFSVGGVTTPSDDFPASRNGWRSAVQLAYKNTSPRGAMFIDMRCSDTPRGGGIPMAQCYWNSELKRASCGLEGSEGPVKNPLDTPYHKAAALREETTLAGLHPRRVKSKR